jgi:hypothetical protein
MEAKRILTGLFGTEPNRFLNGEQPPYLPSHRLAAVADVDGAQKRRRDTAKEDHQDDSHGRKITTIFAQAPAVLVRICRHGKYLAPQLLADSILLLRSSYGKMMTLLFFDGAFVRCAVERTRPLLQVPPSCFLWCVAA